MNTRERFRAANVFNTWELLSRFATKGKTDFACTFRAREARACRPPTTQVWSPSIKTDPNAAWYNYGQKAFVGKRAESMPMAIAWASQQYDISRWAPCPVDPTSTVIPADVRKAALEWLSNQPVTNV